MSRLLLVSNRLPVTVKAEKEHVSVVRSAGGLATGLSGPHERSGGLWIGWPGDVSRLSNAQRAEVESQLDGAALRAAVPQLQRGQPLLRGLLQPRPLAAVPLPAGPHAPAGPGLGGLPPGQRALRRPGRAPLPARRHHLGARLPADAGAGACCASGCPRRASATSTTSPSRRPRSSARCRTARSCCRACWARTWSASTRRATCTTSPARCCGVLGLETDMDHVVHEGA